MRSHKISYLVFALSLVLVLSFAPTHVFANQPRSASSYGGTYPSWPTTWKAINSLNDPDDGLTNARIDFVGDATDPGFYIAGNSNYCFFRIRVDDGDATLFSDSHLILIDKDQNGTLDNSFAWDSQSNDQENHGLEMQDPDDIGSTWATTRMDDLDNNNGSKIAPPDFGLSNGDGYVRILNGQSTTNFGTTTFIDIAVSWSYLTTNTTLAKGQSWNIQLGSIDQVNDHGWIDDDVAGNQAPTGSVTFPGTVSFSSTDVLIANLDARNNTFNKWVIIISVFSLCVITGCFLMKIKYRLRKE